MRGLTLAMAMKKTIAETFTRNVMQIPTDADRGMRMGGNAKRLSIDPPSTIDGSMTPAVSEKKVKRRIPISRKMAKSSVWFAVRRR
jgi:hypothetical protein